MHFRCIIRQSMSSCRFSLLFFWWKEHNAKMENDRGVVRVAVSSLFLTSYYVLFRYDTLNAHRQVFRVIERKYCCDSRYIYFGILKINIYTPPGSFDIEPNGWITDGLGTENVKTTSLISLKNIRRKCSAFTRNVKLEFIEYFVTSGQHENENTIF